LGVNDIIIKYRYKNKQGWKICNKTLNILLRLAWKLSVFIYKHLYIFLFIYRQNKVTNTRVWTKAYNNSVYGTQVYIILHSPRPTAHRQSLLSRTHFPSCVIEKSATRGNSCGGENSSSGYRLSFTYSLFISFIIIFIFYYTSLSGPLKHWIRATVICMRTVFFIFCNPHLSPTLHPCVRKRPPSFVQLIMWYTSNCSGNT